MPKKNEIKRTHGGKITLAIKQLIKPKVTHIYFLFTLVFDKRKPNTNSSLKLNYIRLIVTNQTLLMQYRYKQSFWDRYRWCLTKKFLIICKDRSAVESILETTVKRLHYYLFAVVILNNLTLLFSFTRTRTFCILNDQHDHTDNIHRPVHVYGF